MTSLNCLRIHERLHAGKEHEAGALARQETDSSQNFHRIVFNVLVVCAHHYCSHDLSSHDHQATNNGRKFAVKFIEYDSRDDSYQGACIEPKIEQIEHIIVNLVLFFDMIEVSKKIKSQFITIFKTGVLTSRDRIQNQLEGMQRLQQGIGTVLV